MADVNENVVVNNDNNQAQANQAPDAAQLELKQWMDYSVLGKVPEVQPEQQQEQVLSNEQEQVVKSDEPKPTQVVADPFAPFKEKYGYQSPDDIIKDIEDYRKIKENPDVEVEFENEQSRTLYSLIKEGKTKEVYNILAQQERLDSLTGLEVNKDTAADIIKFGMQLKYKDLSQDEINYKFSKQFAYPKEPVQAIDETDDEFSLRKGEWQEQVRDIDMSKIIEAKLMKPELEAAKVNIKLPEIENSVDEQYAQWLKSLEEAPKVDAEVKEAYKAFTPQSIKTKIDFNDEANKISFPFEFEPDAESFESVRQLVSDGDLFKKAYQGQDGNPDRERFLRDLYYGRNIQKVLTAAMTQAKNATIKAQLPDNSQGAGMNRQAAQTQEPSELDKMMQQSLYPFQRR